MIRDRQRKTARIRLDNPVISKKKLVAMGGYSKSVQKQPGKVLESKGYKEALRELGLTEELITTALVSDIEEKPKNRLGELRLGSEILKMTESENGEVTPRVININFIGFNGGNKPEHKSDNQAEGGLVEVAGQ